MTSIEFTPDNVKNLKPFQEIGRIERESIKSIVVDAVVVLFVVAAST